MIGNTGNAGGTNLISFDPATATMTVEYTVNNEYESDVYNMRLKGTNADSTSAQRDFTLTIVRNCAAATVIAPTTLADYTYKINSGTITKTIPAFTSSDSYCVPHFTCELQLAGTSAALPTTWSNADFVYKTV